MDYSRTGGPKGRKNAPKYVERGQGPDAKRPDKRALLDRMKAATEPAMSDDDKKKPAEIEGQPLDRKDEASGNIAIDEQGPKTIRGPEDIDGEKSE